MPQFIRIDTGPVATVTLTRADLHNAFNDQMILEITDAFRQLGGQAGLRAIILAAEGKSFCAGADVNWMKRMIGYSFDENVADARTLARMLRAIRDCPAPVIARVHGAALGGGVGLVAAADMAVAIESAQFSLSEVRLGILPAVISPYVMEKIGPGHMRRYGVTAERFDAAEARRIGLVCEVRKSTEECDACITGIIDALRACGPEAVGHCKRLIADVYGRNFDELEELTIRRIAERRVSPEGQEGLRSFLEKRTPNWSA